MRALRPIALVRWRAGERLLRAETASWGKGRLPNRLTRPRPPSATAAMRPNSRRRVESLGAVFRTLDGAKAFGIGATSSILS